MELSLVCDVRTYGNKRVFVCDRSHSSSSHISQQQMIGASHQLRVPFVVPNGPCIFSSTGDEAKHSPHHSSVINGANETALCLLCLRDAVVRRSLTLSAVTPGLELLLTIFRRVGVQRTVSDMILSTSWQLVLSLSALMDDDVIDEDDMRRDTDQLGFVRGLGELVTLMAESPSFQLATERTLEFAASLHDELRASFFGRDDLADSTSGNIAGSTCRVMTVATPRQLFWLHALFPHEFCRVARQLRAWPNTLPPLIDVRSTRLIQVWLRRFVDASASCGTPEESLVELLASELPMRGVDSAAHCLGIVTLLKYALDTMDRDRLRSRRVLCQVGHSLVTTIASFFPRLTFGHEPSAIILQSVVPLAQILSMLHSQNQPTLASSTPSETFLATSTAELLRGTLAPALLSVDTSAASTAIASITALSGTAASLGRGVWWCLFRGLSFREFTSTCSSVVEYCVGALSSWSTGPNATGDTGAALVSFITCALASMTEAHGTCACDGTAVAAAAAMTSRTLARVVDIIAANATIIPAVQKLLHMAARCVAAATSICASQPPSSEAACQDWSTAFTTFYHSLCRCIASGARSVGSDTTGTDAIAEWLLGADLSLLLRDMADLVVCRADFFRAVVDGPPSTIDADVLHRALEVIVSIVVAGDPLRVCRHRGGDVTAQALQLSDAASISTIVSSCGPSTFSKLTASKVPEYVFLLASAATCDGGLLCQLRQSLEALVDFTTVGDFLCEAMCCSLAAAANLDSSGDACVALAIQWIGRGVHNDLHSIARHCGGHDPSTIFRTLAYLLQCATCDASVLQRGAIDDLAVALALTVSATPSRDHDCSLTKDCVATVAGLIAASPLPLAADVLRATRAATSALDAETSAGVPCVATHLDATVAGLCGSAFGRRNADKRRILSVLQVSLLHIGFSASPHRIDEGVPPWLERLCELRIDVSIFDAQVFASKVFVRHRVQDALTCRKMVLTMLDYLVQLRERAAASAEEAAAGEMAECVTTLVASMLLDAGGRTDDAEGDTLHDEVLSHVVAARHDRPPPLSTLVALVAKTGHVALADVVPLVRRARHHRALRFVSKGVAQLLAAEGSAAVERPVLDSLHLSLIIVFNAALALSAARADDPIHARFTAQLGDLVATVSLARSSHSSVDVAVSRSLVNLPATHRGLSTARWLAALLRSAYAPEVVTLLLPTDSHCHSYVAECFSLVGHVLHRTPRDAAKGRRCSWYDIQRCCDADWPAVSVLAATSMALLVALGSVAWTQFRMDSVLPRRLELSIFVDWLSSGDGTLVAGATAALLASLCPPPVALTQTHHPAVLMPFLQQPDEDPASYFALVNLACDQSITASLLTASVGTVGGPSSHSTLAHSCPSLSSHSSLAPSSPSLQWVRRLSSIDPRVAAMPQVQMLLLNER